MGVEGRVVHKQQCVLYVRIPLPTCRTPKRPFYRLNEHISGSRASLQKERVSVKALIH